MEKKKLLYRIVSIVLSFSVIAIKLAVASDVAKLGGMVEQAGNKVLEEKEFYQQIVEDARLAQEIRALKFVNGHDQTILDKIANNAHNITNSQKNASNLIVFVSFSMPQELLWSYQQQIKAYGGRMVIKGLVNNSFKSTIKAMQIDQDRTLVLEINPELFKKHQVTQVPTIIISKNDQEFDKFTGSVTIAHALDQARSK